jgi:cytochrome P450 family 9
MLLIVGAILLILIIGFILMYQNYAKSYKYFEEKDIAYIKPMFPFGSNANILLMKESMPEFFKNCYLKNADKKIIGLFDGKKPQYIIGSPELAKQLCIKDFDSFVDHRVILDKDADDLFTKSLIMLKGEKWRNMRSTLSPAFTGSKMRIMHDLIKKCVCSAIWTVENHMHSNRELFEMKNFFSNCSVDVIATCAFGIEVDSFKNPDNEFKTIAKKTSNPRGIIFILKVLILNFFPRLVKLLKISFLESSTAQFFRTTIIGAMNYREKNNINRPDMIDLLLQAKKGKLKHLADEENKHHDSLAAVDESDITKKHSNENPLTDDDLVAQCILFFLAGFDTVSNALAFASYELAVNPDVQEKLRAEINETELNTKQNLHYDDLQKMKYMDNFVTEVLRKWPPAFLSERICNKDCTVEIENGKQVTIKNKQIVLMPIIGFHHDPAFFPNPDKFDPDRFNEDNKDKQNMNAFMPFGLGPRNCIGSRFALMEFKTVLYYMLLNFKINVCEKTQIPLKYLKSMTVVKAEKDIWIELEKLK